MYARVSYLFHSLWYSSMPDRSRRMPKSGKPEARSVIRKGFGGVRALVDVHSSVADNRCSFAGVIQVRESRK